MGCFPKQNCQPMAQERLPQVKTIKFEHVTCFFVKSQLTLFLVFLDRVFQECLTYEGEMDYKTYLDFVLAIENKREPAALQYLFKLLDVQQKNYLTQFDLNYFFRAIQHMMIQHGQVKKYFY